jgi:hypothetical protein
MKSVAVIRSISNSALLSYVYFNPIFRATRMVRKRLKRQLAGKARWARFRTF